MKKIIIPFFCALILVGCAKEAFFIADNESEEIEIDYSARVFKVGLSQGNNTTKTYLDTDKKVYWNANDLLSVFNGSTANQQYVFKGNDGDRSGSLMKTAQLGLVAGSLLDANYALYPYDGKATISEEGVMTVSLPATQTYCSTGFGPGANTMVSVTENTSDDYFNFKNVGGYLVVKLYGDADVQSVVLKGNKSEKIAGKADVSISYGGNPTVSMSEEATTSITLTCPSSVKIGTEVSSATEFWFVLPPVSFTQGYTIQVNSTDGSFVSTVSEAVSVSRNKIVRAEPCSVTTKAGQFVRLIKEEEILGVDRLKEVAYEYLDEYLTDKGAITDWLLEKAVQILDLNGDIEINRIVYTTKDPQGNVVEASGLVGCRSNISTYSKILSVQHYTCSFDEAPTLLDFPVEMIASMKWGNQVVVLADYLGYGVSHTPGNDHPYMHDKMTGTVCADLIEAAEAFLQSHEGKKRSSYGVTLDLMGYSQGGAATISTLYELERRNYPCTIGEVRGGGGPYDLEAFLNKFCKDPDTPFSHTDYLALFLRGMDYGDQLNLNPEKIYAPHVFSSGAYNAFTTMDVDYWGSYLTRDVKKLFNEDFFAAPDFNGNEDILKLYESAIRNSTINSTPKNASKIVLYHCEQDDIVPYECSKAASEKWGCELVSLEKDNHNDCGIEFFIRYLGESLWWLVKSFI